MQKEKTPYNNGLCTIDESDENSINEDLIPKIFDSTCREYFKFYFKAMFISFLVIGLCVIIIIFI
tara:strand:- start:438 stop:632 length:195 start_codon:yes stop_codon:yes gene_type:complete